MDEEKNVRDMEGMPETASGAPPDNKTQKLGLFDKVLIVLAIAILLLTPMLKHHFCITRVSGSSMEPSLHDGDIVYGHRLKEGEALEYGEIVVLESPLNNSKYIKRIVGIPGDVMRFENGVLYINGHAEDSSMATMQDAGVLNGNDVTVKDGYYYVLGDNRNGSMDSRIFGAVSADSIDYVVDGRIKWQ